MAVALAATLAVAGCAGSSARSEPPAATAATTGPEAPATVSTTTPTTAPPASDEEAVRATYQAYLDTWIAANNPPNPDHPDLERYFTGPALAKAKDEITKNKALGFAIRLPEPTVSGFTVQSLSILDDRAEMDICLVDDGIVFEQANGRVLNDKVISSQIRVVVVRLGVAWLVEENAYQRSVDGAQGCGA